jgi:hypothetical protein
MGPNIGILTLQDDLHALAIRESLTRYPGVHCDIVETDRICSSGDITWSAHRGTAFKNTVRSRDGSFVDVAALDLVWLRRHNYPQQVPEGVDDPIQTDLLNNDCRESLIGLFLTEFKGIWVNDPSATRFAENKLVQLRAAISAGLQIPSTIVTQDPEVVRVFRREMGGQVIVKPVRGTQRAHLFTRMLSEDHLASDDSVRLCPAIYQEYVRGDTHVRAHVFGDTVVAASIKSNDVDWRENLAIPFEPFQLPESEKGKLRALLKALGLEMGVVDYKISPDGELFWLEINPQGQFLFVEGMSGMDLRTCFADFLYGLAEERPDNQAHHWGEPSR